MKPQPWLAPLALLYGAAVHIKNAAHDRGFLRQRTLVSPVVSVGNLSAGGGGKTPLVIALAQLLTSNHIAVDVLSRGYKRHSKATMRVQPDGTSEDFGDEPLLIARTTGVPVYVGRERYAAGLLAETDPATGHRVHLLDDGFQHRRLARTIEMVTVRATDLQDRLLPRGYLREPLSSLRRADIVALRSEERAIENTVRRYLRPDAIICFLERKLEPLSVPEPALAFCGIARPENFFADLRKLGLHLAHTMQFQDHHRFQRADLESIARTAVRVKAQTLILTEKDAIRLSNADLQWLQQRFHIATAKLVTRVTDERTLLDFFRKKLPL